MRMRGRRRGFRRRRRRAIIRRRGMSIQTIRITRESIGIQIKHQ